MEMQGDITKDKKGFYGSVGLLALITSLLVLLLVVGKVNDLWKTFNGTRPDNVFSVSAEGKVKAVPDTAIVTLGVISQGKDAKEAQNQGVQKINQITEFVKSLGVAKEDITTTQSSINPRYSYQPDGQNNIIGYESYQNITIKVRKVNESSEIVGKLMSGAVEKGANNVQGSQFVIDDPDSLKQEARKLAIANAKVKAEELAKEAGITLGKVVSVSENGNGYMPMYAKDYAMGMGEGIGGGGAPVTLPNVEVGSQEVIQNITLTFQVK
jgi:uncharacterized protein YggE